MIFKAIGLRRVQKKFQEAQQRLENPKTGMEVVAAKGFKDVMDHFDKEEGPRRPWAKWNRQRKDGSREFFNSRPTKRGGTKLLQDTGRLRGATRFKTLRKEAHVYNNTKYAKFHNEGTSKMVQRKIMWLSPKALKNISKYFARYLVRGS